MVLEQELKYFAENKEELLSHYKNQFALIKDASLLGTFTTEAEAYQAGIQKLGNQPFLIKKVVIEEDVDRIPALVLGLINAHQ
ncbi:MAG: hypothetical protein NVS2B14_17780 [Chamaesiphon sp.]